MSETKRTSTVREDATKMKPAKETQEPRLTTIIKTRQASERSRPSPWPKVQREPTLSSSPSHPILADHDNGSSLRREAAHDQNPKKFSDQRTHNEKLVGPLAKPSENRRALEENLSEKARDHPEKI